MLPSPPVGKLLEPERVPIDLLAALSVVADPRARRGLRLRFAAILALSSVRDQALDINPQVARRGPGSTGLPKIG